MNFSIPSSIVLKRYLANTCTDEERAMVDAWYQSLNLESAETFSQTEETALYQRIQNQIHEEELIQTDKKVIPLPVRTFLRAAAATIILAIGFHYFSQNISGIKEQSTGKVSTTDITFKNSEKKIIRYALPDHSVVWLQPGASVIHPSIFDPEKNREIRFTGEGFFDISHDKEHPFIVNCGRVKTQVLGTTFHVRANENESTFKVFVVTGSVSVTTPNNKNKIETVVLRPREQAVYEKVAQNVTVNIPANNETVRENWQTVSLAFNETPMGEVAERLQHTFNIKIEFNNVNIKKCRLKVDFNNQRLAEILDIIDILLGTTYEMNGNKIMIKGEGCKN